MATRHQEFPILQQERRGLLRIWGRGEGRDSSSPVDRVDRETIYDVSDTGAPSPADCWGGIAPDFIEPIFWKYVKSYPDNIQNMHPLIIPVELNAIVKVFMDTIQFVPSTPSSQAETRSKRKRSPGPDSTEPPSRSPKLATRAVFQRSINSAVALLVLALGKICLHKERIPDVIAGLDYLPMPPPLWEGSWLGQVSGTFTRISSQASTTDS